MQNGETDIKWLINTCTLSPAGSPPGLIPGVSGLALHGSASAASVAWGTPAAQEAEGSLSCLAWAPVAQQRPEVVQGTDVHWKQG